MARGRGALRGLAGLFMRGRFVHVLGTAVFLAACTNDPPPVNKEPLPATTANTAAQRIEWIKAPPGEDVATLVKRELERAQADKKRLLVYVGATWCEPCQRFHDATVKGELDGVFPNVRMVEFDLDVDAERLARAGYASKMIPLFVVPTENGIGSDKRIEGSIKGEGAVMNLRTRLAPLMAD